MVGAMIHKEFLEKLISFRFFLATALCVVVLPGVVYVRAREYASRALSYPKTVDSYRQDVRMLPREFSWAIFGRTLARPLSPLGVVAEPADLRDGGAVELMWRDVPKHSRSADGNPLPRLFPTLDVVAFVAIIMSLLAIAFSFDSVCGERQLGTLKLTFANAVPRATILVGKWAGGMAALALPVLIGGLLSALVLTMTMSGHLTPAHWLEILVILLLSLLYLSVTYTAGMLVSCFTASPPASAAWLLLLWAVAFLAYPNLAPVGAAWLAPAPGRKAYEEEVQARHGEVFQRTYQEWQKFVEENPNIEREDNAGWWISQRERYRDEMTLFAEQVGTLHEEYARKLDQQVGVASNLLRVTPLGSYVLAAREVSGTGPTERANVLAALARYRSAFFIYFANRSVEMFKTRKAQGLPQVPPYTPGDFPVFEYQETTVRGRLSRSLLDGALLIAWSVVFFLASYMRFLRYDVS